MTGMAYILFSQTLHQVSGWSRLGVIFAALLVLLLASGWLAGLWSFRFAKWIWFPVLWLTYCLFRSVPEPGNGWPLDQLYPLTCALLGGIGIAVALQAGVSFRAIASAQLLSILCNIVAGFLGIGTEAVGQQPVRYAGVIGNANDFGLQLAVGACLIWLLPEKAGRLPCWFAILSVAYAIATSGSRTALLVAPFFALIVFIQSLALIKKRRLLVVGLVVAGTCLAGAVAGPVLLQRAQGITAVNRTTDLRDSSFEKRLGMIQEALKLWRQAPVFGNGLDGFERLAGYSVYAHNNYAELLCNTGLIGAFLYYGLHLSVVFRARRWPARLRFYSWVFVLMLLTIDVGSVNYQNKQVIMVLMILLSIPFRRHVARAAEQAGAAKRLAARWPRFAVEVRSQ